VAPAKEYAENDRMSAILSSITRMNKARHMSGTLAENVKKYI
jgi:hypothetical protein